MASLTNAFIDVELQADTTTNVSQELVLPSSKLVLKSRK
jgi:hypothetical protein